ncbi:Brp/Blh family beta-carotene 15,15'-dioxygenase [Micromonospora sp. Llam0]|uniref:Brp/Blh family beta-carotene 15,15'-dioxygenase n=1 Tax=Micromonospora sp. Llam0 TaxID=2485143 RepID=UPI0013152AA4|nr:Brp/Blh family beta-carotene 15,15'-dioxygenase [Micromonospora sp. Llam0]
MWPERQPDTGQWLLRRAGRFSALALVAVLLLDLLALRPAGPASHSPLPLPLLAGLLIGLPHGAVDHLVPAWLSVPSRGWRPRAGLLAGYVGAAGFGWWICHTASGPMLIAFLALTIGHFGAGDESFHRQRDGRGTPVRPYAVLAYGAPPVLLPLALWRDQVDPLLESIDSGAADLLTTELCGAAVALAGAAMVVTAMDDLRAGRRGDAAYLGLLVAVFALVPPALAFATYFAAGHSVRHVARLLCADPANAVALSAGRLGPPLLRFAAQAAIPVGVVLVVLVPITVSTTPDAAVSTGFAVLAGLTAPHAMLVFWLDRRAAADSPGEVRSGSPGCSPG